MCKVSPALKFPIKPEPKVGESLKGYVLRLGWDNGRTTLARILPILGIGTNAKQIFKPAEPAAKVLLQQIASSLSLALDTLLDVFPSDVDDNPLFHAGTNRVCITCCQHESTRYFHKHWEQYHFTHCELHHTRLIVSCPSCHQELPESGVTLEGCAHCGLMWEDWCPLPEKVPPYQAVLSHLSCVERQAYLARLYDTLMVVLHPKHINPPVYKGKLAVKNGSTDHWHMAYLLLTCQSTRNLWQCLRLNMLSTDSELHFLTQNQREHLAALALNNTPSYLARQMLGHQKQLDISSLFHQGADTSLLVSKVQAAVIANLNLDAIQHILHSNDLRLQASQYDVHLYDLRDAIKSVCDEAIINPSMESEHLISLGTLEKGLKYFNASFADLLSVINRHSIDLFQVDVDKPIAIRELHISRRAIVRALEHNFLTSLNKPLSIARFKEVTFLIDEQYQALKQVVILNEVKLSYYWSIDGSSLSQFFNRYVLINRWAKIQSMKLQEVEDYLNSFDGLRPVSINCPSKLVLYENNHQLVTALRHLAKLSNSEHKMLTFICI